VCYESSPVPYVCSVRRLFVCPLTGTDLRSENGML